jgi:hypothetical protein
MIPVFFFRSRWGQPQTFLPPIGAAAVWTAHVFNASAHERMMYRAIMTTSITPSFFIDYFKKKLTRGNYFETKVIHDLEL